MPLTAHVFVIPAQEGGGGKAAGEHASLPPGTASAMEIRAWEGRGSDHRVEQEGCTCMPASERD